MFTPNWANGYNDESKGFVSVFLKNQGDDEVSVKCQLITDVKTMEFGFNFPLPAKLCRGYSKFLTHAACAEVYKDTDFVVTAKVEMVGKVVKIVGGQSGPDPKKARFNVWESVYEKMEGRGWQKDP